MITLDNYLFTSDHGCGRYTLRDTKKIKKRFKIDGDVPEIKPNYNTAPTHVMPVVIYEDGKHQLKMMKWGFTLPQFGDDKKEMAPKPIFNTREDKILHSNFWKKSFLERRCLVIADGYYEWKKLPKNQTQPYFFHLDGDPLFSFAGIYRSWTDKHTGEIIPEYSIITSEPNEVQKPIHNRMPVILDPDEEDDWIETPVDKAEGLMPVLNPFERKSFNAYPVGKDVSNYRNNNAGILERVELNSK